MSEPLKSAPTGHMNIRASDDVELAADVWNSDQANTLLLLPCGAETRIVWRPVVDRLVADVRDSWRIIAADHRGHGGSGRSLNYSFQRSRDDVATWIAELATRPLVIGGGSIGGALGMVAAGEGEPIDGLILLDVPVAPVLERVLAERSRIQSAAKVGHASIATVDPRYISGGVIEDVFRDVGRWSRAARNLKIPTMLIAGSSGVIGPEQLQEYKEHIPQGELAQLQTSHLVARDDPEGVATILGEFLARHWQKH
ncbi:MULTISPECIES: alpha/beta fold hydrolase [unclassified Bradyrhizobium]|uniref:alpha/beta fold hydrolase n=1 Tax=unclassified Bradyrhizobium TaxID=2631580 RepID=UPI0028E8C196|nr:MULTISPECIES: alpha/beta fold hydrolase [unclassified Bradyrhizobium]